MGQYTGNGSADGVFVYLGFKPAFLLIKRTDIAGSWYIWDTARVPYNTNGLTLNPNASSAEGSANNFDLLSNGFKARDTGGGFNGAGGTYVYAAFASNPFGGSGAAPVTAR